MNVVAIDIGNRNVNVGLFLDGEEQFVKPLPGDAREELANLLQDAWEQVPVSETSKEGKRDGVILVSSVKPAWTEKVEQIVQESLGEKIQIIGRDIPMPMPLWVDEPDKVGTDRVVSAAVAYNVVEQAVVVADFGTAVTIDLVDDQGIFLGGVICPGFETSAEGLERSAAQLPKVKVTKPQTPFGKNTAEAINCGLYYSAVATLQEVVRRYAEEIGKWPHTVITGSGAELIREDCEFIDSYVPNLVVKGIVLAYQKHLAEKR